VGNSGYNITRTLRFIQVTTDRYIEWLAFLRIREVPGSNLGPDTSCSSWDFSWHIPSGQRFGGICCLHLQVSTWRWLQHIAHCSLLVVCTQRTAWRSDPKGHCVSSHYRGHLNSRKVASHSSVWHSRPCPNSTLKSLIRFVVLEMMAPYCNTKNITACVLCARAFVSPSLP
jgi:hypothetical protein